MNTDQHRRPAAEILEFLENEIPNKVKDWKVPLLLQHGTKDELCIPEASKRFFSMMTSDKKHRKLVVMTDYIMKFTTLHSVETRKQW